jgi:hypothetical protein
MVCEFVRVSLKADFELASKDSLSTMSSSEYSSEEPTASPLRLSTVVAPSGGLSVELEPT